MTFFLHFQKHRFFKVPSGMEVKLERALCRFEFEKRAGPEKKGILRTGGEQMVRRTLRNTTSVPLLYQKTGFISSVLLDRHCSQTSTQVWLSIHLSLCPINPLLAFI
jgi:hypothetical protein